MSGRRPSLEVAAARARSVIGAIVVAQVIAQAVTVGACAGRAVGPGDTLGAFGAALERKDYAAAYALTSAAYQARVPLAAFGAQLEEGGADTLALGQKLRVEVAHRPGRVELEVDPGRAVSLVEEGGGWRVDGPSFEPWSQRTPRAALRTFVRALELGRYDIVLRLAPADRRAGLSVETLRAFWEGQHRVENAQLVARLRAALGAPIVETADEARMPYADHEEARFVREDGVWKIEDPD